MRKLIFACCFLGVASAAAAQTPVVNPSAVEFLCPDHDRDTDHELKILRVEGTNRVVITTILLGDPPVDPADGLVKTSINVQPIAFGTYVATVSAIAVDATGATVKSTSSAESNQFARAPGGPSKVVVK